VQTLVSRIGRIGWLLPLGLLAGCGWFGSKDDTYVEQPVEVLYNRALDDLGAQNYKEAAKEFEEVDRQHPYSEWARKSLIMSAYAYYSAGQYDESINAAKRYITLHPGSSDAAYAQYLIGASYFDQIPDISRDQTRTERAIAALEEVTRKFPNTEYAESARKKIEVGRDQLAAKEMDIGRWYLKKKDFIGAINRFKMVVTQYQRTRHVEEALERLTECYMALGITMEAQTAAAVLGHNFPDSPWYKDAYRLVRSGGVEPREDKGSWMSKAFRVIGFSSKKDTVGAGG
jgi:outer membrane protein assembly factor BamD